MDENIPNMNNSGFKQNDMNLTTTYDTNKPLNAIGNIITATTTAINSGLTLDQFYNLSTTQESINTVL